MLTLGCILHLIIPSVMHISLLDDGVFARVELMAEQMRQSIVIMRACVLIMFADWGEISSG